MQVISLEEDKIEIKPNEVIKRSFINEYNFLEYAKKLSVNLENIKIDNKKYSIKIPELYKFKEGKIYMERCYGDNLEIMLRKIKTHQKGVKYTNSLLHYFIENNFYWKDFAPRNILIGENEISIMDFERGITTKTNNINEYFWNSVYEEYGAFLLPSERIYNMDDIFQTNSKDTIPISYITSKRVQNILKQLGYKDIVPPF